MMWFKQLFKINSNVIFLLVVFLCLLVTGTAVALDGNEILLQVDRNLQPESYEMYRKLINIEPDGSKKEYVLYTVKKGQDRMVALFLSPASEKGRSTLRLGGEPIKRSTWWRRPKRCFTHCKKRSNAHYCW